MNQDFQQPQQQPQAPLTNVTNDEPAPTPQYSSSLPAQPKKKRGGKVVLLLVAILLVAGAAIGGWWYGTIQAQKESDAKIAELNSKISDLNKKIAAADSEDTERSNDAVVVKQWDIQFESDDPTIKYQIDTADQNKLLLYTDASKALAEKCFPDYDKIYGLTITRSSSKINDPESQQLTYVKQLGNTYYYSNFPDGGCQSQSAQSDFDSVNASLKATSETLTQA